MESGTKDIELLRKEALRIAAETDNILLLEQFIENWRKDFESEIVGYTPDGKPITGKDLNKRAELAERSYAEGRVKTLAEVRQMLDEETMNI